MLSYAGSRLAATREEDIHSIQFALGALRKSVCTKSNERLLIEVEIFVPKDIADFVLESDKRRLVAEIVLKLVKQLKAGPLKRFNNNRDYLNGAIAFLATEEGNRWVHSWFLPNDIPHNHAQAPDAHAKETQTMTSSHPSFPRSNSSRNPYLRPIYDTTIPGLSLSLPPLASGSAETITLPKPRVHQHRRVHIEPISLLLPLHYDTVHRTFPGGPLPTISPLAATLTLDDMEGGGIAKNKKFSVQVMQHCVNPTIMLVTLLLAYLLTRLTGYPI